MFSHIPTNTHHRSTALCVGCGVAVGYLLSKISTKQLQKLIGSGGGGFDLQKAVRPNIMALKPYVCARDDYTDGKIRNAIQWIS